MSFWSRWLNRKPVEQKPYSYRYSGFIVTPSIYDLFVKASECNWTKRVVDLMIEQWPGRYGKRRFYTLITVYHKDGTINATEETTGWLCYD